MALRYHFKSTDKEVIKIKIIELLNKFFSGDKDSGKEVTCAGCNNLSYNCCGQAECLKNRDKYCPQSGFAYRED